MIVRFTPHGDAKYLSHLKDIQKKNPAAATKIAQHIRRSLLLVGEHPHMGRVIPEYPDLPYREIIVLPYRLFYRITTDTIWVVDVWHGKQVPEKPIFDEELLEA